MASLIGPHEIVGPGEVAGAARHAGVRADAAAQQHDLAVGAARDVSQQPQAMDVGREHRHHHRGGGVLDHPLEHVTDVDLVADVFTDVAGFGERGGVGDGVRDADRLDGERPDREDLARPRDLQTGVREDLVFAEPLADEAERVGRRPHRDVVPPQDVGERADVVLVPVGHDDARDARSERIEGAEIGMHHVHAEAAIVERHPAIDEDDLAALLDGHAVHAHFAQPAERQEANGRAGAWRHYGGHAVDLARLRSGFTATRGYPI